MKMFIIIETYDNQERFQGIYCNLKNALKDTKNFLDCKIYYFETKYLENEKSLIKWNYKPIEVINNKYIYEKLSFNIFDVIIKCKNEKYIKKDNIKIEKNKDKKYQFKFSEKPYEGVIDYCKNISLNNFSNELIIDIEFTILSLKNHLSKQNVLKFLNKDNLIIRNYIEESEFTTNLKKKFF